ncbi:hypothetical protein BDF14DRAFT_1778255 [Spinellus fusiger]|nr:hypothetical protein BDF14DRAFT_1778255 [Spinellus fusiger]
MKLLVTLGSCCLLAFSLVNAQGFACDANAIVKYRINTPTNVNLQYMIDKAQDHQRSLVKLKPGKWIISDSVPTVLVAGVSIKGDVSAPTIISSSSPDKPATIIVPELNYGWSIQNIVFDNVNIQVEKHQNEVRASIMDNVFLNGGVYPVYSKGGRNLFVDGNIFLRDRANVGKNLSPDPLTTNAAIHLEEEQGSVVSNNIVGMDLRQMDKLFTYAAPQLHRPLYNIKFYSKCVGRHIENQQGYMASGVQLIHTTDITIKQNIMNATLPYPELIEQDHGVSVIGSKQTYIYQNFIAGWMTGDFGGAVRLTSVSDSYVVSNYLANTAVMVYIADHAEYMEVDNVVVANNFLYRFMTHNLNVASPTYGWLYEGITFFDFYTARRNYTIPEPVWNSSVDLSPLITRFTVTGNKFASTPDVDPYMISLGNLPMDQSFVDRTNCYVNSPLDPNSVEPGKVSVLWRQMFASKKKSAHGNKIPESVVIAVKEDQDMAVPAHIRNLHIPPYWKAYTLRNNEVPMTSPMADCLV